MISAKINGVSYPLKMGMYAVKQLEKSLGSLKDIIEMLSSSDRDISDRAVYELAYWLIQNGLLAEKYESSAAVERPKLESAEHIEAVTGLVEFAKLSVAVQRAITEDGEVSIQAEIPSEDGLKNAQATQEQ